MKNLALTLGFLVCFLGGCGGSAGDNDSSGSPPDLTGDWVGTFTSNDGGNTQTVYMVVTNQKKKNFSGTWESDVLISQGQVSGSIYPGNDNRWIADLDMTQGDDITCCVPLLGCYVFPFTQIYTSGYYESESITDEAASYNYGCFTTDGVMTLTRQ